MLQAGPPFTVDDPPTCYRCQEWGDLIECYSCGEVFCAGCLVEMMPAWEGHPAWYYCGPCLARDRADYGRHGEMGPFSPSIELAEMILSGEVKAV